MWSWFVCKEKKRLFTCSGHAYKGRTVAIDEEEVVIEGECRMRVKEREGCVLVADKWGGMA